MKWHIYTSLQKLVALLRKNKKLVLLFSIPSRPIIYKGKETFITPHRNSRDQPVIKTHLVYLKYTNNIHGVDIANHLRSNYSCQVKTHKW